MSPRSDGLDPGIFTSNRQEASVALVRLQRRGIWKRRAAARALTEILNGDNAFHRLCALHALGRIGTFDKAGVIALERALRDPNKTVCGLAVDAFAKIRQPVSSFAVRRLMRWVASGEALNRSRGIRALGRMGPAAKKAAPVLYLELHRKESRLKAAALEALGGIEATSGRLRQQLLLLLSDGDGMVRAKAMGLLGDRPRLPRSLLPLLVAALRDREEMVRPRAARALSRLTCPNEAIPGLIAALQDKGNAGLRYHAAAALGRIRPGSPAAVHALIRARQDKDAEIRRQARMSLRMLRA